MMFVVHGNRADEIRIKRLPNNLFDVAWISTEPNYKVLAEKQICAEDGEAIRIVTLVEGGLVMGKTDDVAI